MPKIGLGIATLSGVTDCTFIIARNTCRFATISVLWKKNNIPIFGIVETTSHINA